MIKKIIFALMKNNIGNDQELAVKLLLNNELVAIPTETVYGLAANGLSESAVAKIFEVKNRPFFDPLILHVTSVECIREYVTDFPIALQKLAATFCPGPITFLLPKKEIIPDIVTSGLPRAAFRIPNHAVTLSILHKLPFPLAAPSANPFTYISPTTAVHVATQLGNKIPYILDGGECSIGLESTIVGEENGKIIVYRLGGLAIEAIEEVVGKVEYSTTPSSSLPHAPGSSLLHYAPSKQLYRGNIGDVLANFSTKDIAVISFATMYKDIPAAQQFILSPTGDLAEAATKLFAAMRLADNLGIKIIFAEYFPNEGLGRAINDRLARAERKV